MNLSLYAGIVEGVASRIQSSQYKALKSVNTELISLYWDIGKQVSQMVEVHDWGRSVVDTLSKDIRKKFPDVSGFGTRNIWYMKEFYDTYATNEKLQPLVAEISWTKNIDWRCQTKSIL